MVREGASRDGSRSSDSGTSDTTNTEALSQQNAASEFELQQAVHTPILEQQGIQCRTEQTVLLATGWTESYGRWWREHTDTSDCTLLFGVQLIGDAQTP